MQIAMAAGISKSTGVLLQKAQNNATQWLAAALSLRLPEAFALIYCLTNGAVAVRCRSGDPLSFLAHSAIALAAGFLSKNFYSTLTF